jgi:hypothetical protein
LIFRVPDSGAVGPSPVFLLPNDFEELRASCPS